MISGQLGVAVQPTYYMDVSKNRGTPKWMVKIMENPIKMDDSRVHGGTIIFGNTHNMLLFG